MNKIWKIARHTYGIKIRQFGCFVAEGLRFLAWCSLALILALVVFLFRASLSEEQSASETERTGVLDQGDRPPHIPPAFVDRFVTCADEQAASKALHTEEVKAVLIIPADYLQSGKVTQWRRDGQGGLDDQEVRDFLTAWLLEGKVDPATLSRIKEPVDLHSEIMARDGQLRPRVEVYAERAGLILSALLVWCMCFSSGPLLRSLEEDRSRQVLELLLSSVSPAQLLVGRAIGLFVYGLTVDIVLLLAGIVLSVGALALLLGQWFALKPQFFLLAGVYFLLGKMLFGLPSLALFGLPKTGFEKWIVGSLVALLVLAPYGLCFGLGVVDTRVLSIYPLTAPVIMLFRLAVSSVPAMDIVASILMLLVSIALGFFLATKLFRTGMLLHGKPPGLGELVRAFRQA